MTFVLLEQVLHGDALGGLVRSQTEIMAMIVMFRATGVTFHGRVTTVLDRVLMVMMEPGGTQV